MSGTIVEEPRPGNALPGRRKDFAVKEKGGRQRGQSSTGAGTQQATLIVWGTGRRKWAYWLRGTIPGATDVVEIDGARLFFPDERATEFTAALRRHWDAHP